MQNLASTGLFGWTSPNDGNNPISANYLVGFSSTAVSGANKWVFDGSIEVTVIGMVPEPSSLTLLAAGTFSLLAYEWRRRKAKA